MKEFIQGVLLIAGIALIAGGIHYHSIISPLLGGISIGIYQQFLNNKDKN